MEQVSPKGEAGLSNGSARPPPFAPAPHRLSSASKYLLIFGLALLVAFMAGGIMRRRAEVKAVQTMPLEDRARLYERLLENLYFCRANPGEAFERFCTAEARFIVTFPECDDACQELARKFFSHPTR